MKEFGEWLPLDYATFIAVCDTIASMEINIAPTVTVNVLLWLFVEFFYIVKAVFFLNIFSDMKYTFFVLCSFDVDCVSSEEQLHDFKVKCQVTNLVFLYYRIVESLPPYWVL